MSPISAQTLKVSPKESPWPRPRARVMSAPKLQPSVRVITRHTTPLLPPSKVRHSPGS